MGLQFVQLRCRSATRWPTDARLDAIAGDASKPGKRHRHCAKRRRYAMAPPVLQMAFSAAGRAARPLQPVAVGLRRNDRSLNARQKLLRFGQGQSQVSNIAKTFRPADLYQIGAQAAGITLRRNQPQHPSHPRSPGRLSTRPTVPPVSSYPHSLDTPASRIAKSLISICALCTALGFFACRPDPGCAPVQFSTLRAMAIGHAHPLLLRRKVTSGLSGLWSPHLGTPRVRTRSKSGRLPGAGCSQHRRHKPRTPIIAATRYFPYSLRQPPALGHRLRRCPPSWQLSRQTD